MRTRVLFFTTMLAAGTMLQASESDKRRLASANTMFKEIMDAGDRSIPRDLLRDSQCAVLVPGMKKAGFIGGGEYGRGFALCRTPKGWSAPIAMRMEGGSFGFQIGASETDLILLVKSKNGMDHLLKSKFTLGGDATIAAGPVGRESNANTDLTMHAEILSWSRSRGVFAGIALRGATLRPDEDVDTILYGHTVDRAAALNGQVPPPPAAAELVQTLTRYSGVGK